MGDHGEVGEVPLDAWIKDRLGPRVAQGRPVLVQQVHQLLADHPGGEETWLKVIRRFRWWQLTWWPELAPSFCTDPRSPWSRGTRRQLLQGTQFRRRSQSLAPGGSPPLQRILLNTQSTLWFLNPLPEISFFESVNLNEILCLVRREAEKLRAASSEEGFECQVTVGSRARLGRERATPQLSQNHAIWQIQCGRDRCRAFSCFRKLIVNVCMRGFGMVCRWMAGMRWWKPNQCPHSVPSRHGNHWVAPYSHSHSFFARFFAFIFRDKEAAQEWYKIVKLNGDSFWLQLNACIFKQCAVMEMLKQLGCINLVDN